MIMLESIARAIVKHRKLVVVVTLVLTLICGVLATGVRINPSMVDFLPAESASTIAMNKLTEEFDEPVPNVRVMFNDVTLAETLELKSQLAAIENVSEVMWLDDIIDLTIPLDMAPKKTVEQYFVYDKTTGQGDALLTMATISGDSAAINAIYEIIDASPGGGALTGDALVSYAGKELTGKEVGGAIAIIVPLIIIILLITTTSWLEPLLFLCAIGVAVLINMGLNIIVGEISFITNAVGPILQLAVSLDYAIFLLHAFTDYRKQSDASGMPLSPTEAMIKAMKRAFPTIAASAATTLFGFLALCFMRFGVGPNLGINLAKGVLLSFLSVTVFLPALTMLVYKYIDRSKHKPILPAFRSAGRRILKLRIPAIILVIVLMVPCFLAQSQSSFIYGMGEYQPGTRAAEDTAAIEEVFSTSSPIAIAVPRGDIVNEKELGDELAGLPHVTAVISYATTVGAEIPPSFLDEATVARFYSDDYARIIVYSDVADEGDASFALVQSVRELSADYYGESYVASQNTTIYDLKLTITSDNSLVSWLAILAIGVVILLAFRSLSLPIILVLTIEAAIWINLSIPYFSGTPLQYIGYLVVSTVQLGATVDYAILYTGRYLTHRQTQPSLAAAIQAHAESFQSILVSGSILSLAGAALWLSSSSPIVAELGLLIFRGTLLSMLLVTVFLPGILILLDRFVGASTWKSNFLPTSSKGSQHEETN